jgi:DNA-binding NarL/FixJ family response regulator
MRAREDLQVVVVDEHPVVREGLSLLLPRHGIRVIGGVANLADAAQMVERRRPHVVLTDRLRSSGGDPGLAARIAERGVPTRVFVLTASQEACELNSALERGAAGIALKTIESAELARGIRLVASGGVFVEDRVVNLMRVAERGLLTRRQAEVLSLLARGLNADDIATGLDVSVATVHKHVQIAVRRLNARGRLHAVVIAAQRGLISIGLEAASTRSDALGPRALDALEDHRRTT